MGAGRRERTKPVLGSPSVTTQGMGTEEMRVVAELIHRAVTETDGTADHPVAQEIRGRVAELMAAHPAYPEPVTV